MVSVDTKHDLNGRLHHTDQFKTDAIVVRRGQEFLMDVKLSTTFDPSLHSISLELRTGARPNTYERTLIKIPMVKYLDKVKWGMRIVGKSDSTLQVCKMFQNVISFLTSYFSQGVLGLRDLQRDFHQIETLSEGNFRFS